MTRDRLVSLLTNRDDERRIAARKAFFLAARRFTPMLAVEQDGLTFLVETSDRIVGFYTYAHGAFEAETQPAAFLALARHAAVLDLADRTVLEIGGNIGTETVRMLAKHGVGRVVSIEPAPSNVRMLKLNLLANDLSERVKVLPMALSDSDGIMSLALDETNAGGHHLSSDAGSDTGSVSVPVRRLDGLIEDGELDLASIGAVWMDAEGHEGHILAGAQQLLSARIPIVTEYWPTGLRRSGGFDRFHELVAEHFRTVVDLRIRHPGGERVLPASRVLELPASYPKSDTNDRTCEYTDLLLVP